MAKARILYIDALKLFTIYLVLWGHAIMCFQSDYKHSVAFQVIYSFHMPLFMMLSGYFAQSSMAQEAKSFFPKKFRQLLLPCISWGVLCWLVITSGLIQGRFSLTVGSLFTGWLGLIDNFWFLKSCFICYTLTWLCWRCGRYKVLAFVAVWLLCLMQGRFHLNLMFPCFGAGIWLRRWLAKRDMSPVWWPLLSGILFMALLLYKLTSTCSEVDDNLRVAMQGDGFSLWQYFLHQAYQIILGLSGAICCLSVFKSVIERLPVTPTLERIGKWGGGDFGYLYYTGYSSGDTFASVSQFSLLARTPY